jgi:CHAT domain-containing protein
MAATRPSSAIWSGSPNSNPWWEAKEFAAIRDEAAALRAAGDFEKLEARYQSGLTEASELGIAPARVSYLAAIGNARMLRFQYGEALQAYLDGKRLAEETGDWSGAARIALNLIGLYEQVWDYPSAAAAAEEGERYLQRAGPAAREYRAQLLLQLGRIRAGQEIGGAEVLYREGIFAAQDQLDFTLEAQGWDLLGELLQSQGRLEAAERALLEAFRLRSLYSRSNLRLSYGRLGALRLAQYEAGGAENPNWLEEAAGWTKRALEGVRAAGATRSSYLLHHQLGRILQAYGETDQALAEFRSAVIQAAWWRATIPSATSVLTSSNAALDRRVFDAFIEMAAERGLQTRNARLIAESFLANEANRAASLRETQALAGVWRRKLPAAYWQALGALRNEESRLMRSAVNDSPVAARLRLRLTEMEAVAELRFLRPMPEKVLSHSSLIHFQKGLKEPELFLSFHQGKEKSYLWSITTKGILLYKLAAAEQSIAADNEMFRAAVTGETPKMAEIAESIYHKLFGKLGRAELEKPSWLLSVDGALSELPFAALVTERPAGRVRYLIEKHSIQVVPGALLMTDAGTVADRRGEWLMVADPVYNTADPRSDSAIFRWFSSHDDEQLNRLPGGAREVEASIRSADPRRPARVLEGTSATRRNFTAAAQSRPGVIHLATHVLTPHNGRGQAFLAFSMDRESRPELLATSDVAALNTPGALVVMTGCSSGTGDLAQGAGLLGLTRAWMVAGASNVVATGWQVEDRDGGLMPSFYRHWKAKSAAEALRESQLEMIASNSWQAAARYWASFQVSGGTR